MTNIKADELLKRACALESKAKKLMQEAELDLREAKMLRGMAERLLQGQLSFLVEDGNISMLVDCTDAP